MGEKEKEELKTVSTLPYIRISAVGTSPVKGKRPTVEATARIYGQEEWEAIRNKRWEELPAYISDEPRRRKIGKAKAREAKAAAERKELEAQTGA